VPVISIERGNDPRLADYQSVPDPRLALDRGVFVAEGRFVVARLLATRLAVRSVMVTAPALAAIATEVHDRADVPVYLVSQDTMNGVAGFNIHRGCLAIGERPARMDWRGLAATATRAVVLEHVGDADNVGAIVRSAAAFGVDLVLMGPSCADPFYRKAIRTSMGAVLTMPLAEAAPWPGVLHELRAEGWAVLGTTPDPAAPSLRQVAADVSGRPVAVVVGHEGDGLTAEARCACEGLARIPTTHRVDSLNVATATAIALYELCGTQRS
jgi:tRNA G18 (ribose-2'-O)-methylase SpoU